jgi:hypothetical protein
MADPSAAIDKVSNTINHHIEKPQYRLGIKQSLHERINYFIILLGDCLPLHLSVIKFNGTIVTLKSFKIYVYNPV